jgi:hypothetical protein
VELLEDKFDKIQFSFFNGWQTTGDIEIDSMGNFTAWVADAWTEENYKATGALKDSELKKVLWGVNHLYSLPKSYELSRNGCSDCADYGVSLFKAGEVKSFYIKRTKRPSGANLVFSTLLNVIRRSEKIKTKLNPPKLRSNTYEALDSLLMRNQ